MGHIEDFQSVGYGKIDPKDEKNSIYFYKPKTEIGRKGTENAHYMAQTYFFSETLLLDDLVDMKSQYKIMKDGDASVVIKYSKIFREQKHVLVTVCLSRETHIRRFKYCIALQAVITGDLPFWWTDTAKYIMNTGVTVTIKQITYKTDYKKPKGRRATSNFSNLDTAKFKAILGPKIDADFDTYYFIPDRDIIWTSGIAFLGILNAYKAKIVPDMPNIISVTFNKFIDPMKLFIHVDEPFLDDFSSPNRYSLIGHKSGKWSGHLTLPVSRGNTTYTIYIAVQPEVM